MADEIKIEVEALTIELENLKGSIDSFEPYNKNFMEETANKLDEDNSDYIATIQKTLKNMKDTTAPKVMEQAQKIYEQTKVLVGGFEQTDDTIADKMTP